MDQITFTDSEGVAWVVKEDGSDDARPVASDAPPGTTWLRFENDSEVRRLWHYPDDWRGLTAVQLESLLDRASTVIARFRPATHSGVGRGAPLNPERPARSPVPPTTNRADGSPVDTSRRDKK